MAWSLRNLWGTTCPAAISVQGASRVRSVLETNVSLDPELQSLLPNQAPRSWVLIPTLTKRNHGLLKKWLIPGPAGKVQGETGASYSVRE